MRRPYDLATQTQVPVKVTLQDHVIYSSIHIHISITLWTIFIKLHSYVLLSKTVYRAQDLAT